MLNIITKEVPIDEELQSKIQFICDFCNVKPTFINGSIRKIEKTNINYIEPNKIIIKSTTFLAFNHNKDVKILNKKFRYTTSKKTWKPLYSKLFHTFTVKLKIKSRVNYFNDFSIYFIRKLILSSVLIVANFLCSSISFKEWICL